MHCWASLQQMYCCCQIKCKSRCMFYDCHFLIHNAEVDKFSPDFIKCVNSQTADCFTPLHTSMPNKTMPRLLSHVSKTQVYAQTLLSQSNFNFKPNLNIWSIMHFPCIFHAFLNSQFVMQCIFHALLGSSAADALLLSNQMQVPMHVPWLPLSNS